NITCRNAYTPSAEPAMTRRTNARIAGIAYLLYIAVAFPSMLLSDRATAGNDIAAKVVTMAQHAADIRLTVVLSMVGGFCALALVAIALPLQIARVLAGPATQLVWLPVAVFELVIAVWFILKGVAPPLEARQQEVR